MRFGLLERHTQRSLPVCHIQFLPSKDSDLSLKISCLLQRATLIIISEERMKMFT